MISRVSKYFLQKAQQHSGFFYSLFDFRALSNIMCSESLNKKFEVRHFFTMCTNNSDYKGSDEIIASAMGRRNLLKTNAFVLRTLVWCCKQVQCSCSVLKWFWSHKTYLYCRTCVVQVICLLNSDYPYKILFQGQHLSFHI